MELLEAEQRDKEQKAREELRKSIEELEREMDEAKDRKKRDVDVELKEIELEKQRKAEVILCAPLLVYICFELHCKGIERRSRNSSG